MPYLKKQNKQPSRTFNREERQKIYQSTKWKELRQAKLMQQPLCELCLAKGIIKPAEDIHHIDSFMNYTGTKRLAKAFDFNNLMSICKECHAKEHYKSYKCK
jgi:5-methylcytosine-specific restriction protein A